MRATSSLALRLVIAAAAVSLTGLFFGGALLSQAFRTSAERQLDDRLSADLENIITAAEVQPDGTIAVLTVFNDQRYLNAFSGWYWQIAPGGPEAQPGLVASRSLWDQTLNVSPPPLDGGLTKGETQGPEGQTVRYLVRRISFPVPSARPGESAARKLFDFAVAADRKAIDADVSAFNATLWWSLGVLGLVLVLAALVQVRVALRPLREVKDRLADIRTGKAQKLEGDFPVEIAPLAGELNALLTHNAEVVQRARTHVGNLAHYLKTPLTVLANEAAQTKGPLAEMVMRQTGAIRQQVDHYLARARAAASAEVIGSRTQAAPVLADLTRTLQKIYAGRGIRFSSSADEALAFRGERQDFEELAGNLIDNAGKWARSEVTVVAVAEPGGRLVLKVEDDGPGLDEEQLHRVLDKRERIDESVPGSGLGLGIVRDIAQIYGGALTLGRSEALGGLKAELNLPLADT